MIKKKHLLSQSPVYFTRQHDVKHEHFHDIRQNNVGTSTAHDHNLVYRLKLRAPRNEDIKMLLCDAFTSPVEFAKISTNVADTV